MAARSTPAWRGSKPSTTRITSFISIPTSSRRSSQPGRQPRLPAGETTAGKGDDAYEIDTLFPPGFTSVPVTLSDTGAYLLCVDPGGEDANGWTLTIQ